MTGKHKKVRFVNKFKPNSGLDIVKLDELMSRNIGAEITRPHEVSFYAIIIITKGEGRHDIDFAEYSYKPGTVFTVRINHLHCFYQNKDLEGYMILITESFLVSSYNGDEVFMAIQLFNEMLASPQISMSEADFSSMKLLLDMIWKEYFGNNDDLSSSICRSQLQVLLLMLYRYRLESNLGRKSNRKYIEQFLQLQKLVEENCVKTRKVTDYANWMNCSTKTINNITREVIQRSAKEYIAEIILLRAKRMLVSRKYAFKKIAFDCGYEDLSNFYRFFKKQTGYTPDQYVKLSISI